MERFTLRALGMAVACVATMLIAVPQALARAGGGDRGAVYTETNATSGNALLVFDRARDGSLVSAGSYATSGNGTGTALGSGHSVIASVDGTQVLAVNAGSNTLSVFSRRGRRLRLDGDPAPSGGVTPTSVTGHGDLVYVMNAGSGSISGFRLEGGRGLTPIAGSTQPLAAAGTDTDSQIQFDRSGRVLIVDERGPDLIQTFVVGRDGVAKSAHTIAADGGGPFGFDVDQQNHVLFSNAALTGGLMSGASSYDVTHGGGLTPNGSPVSSGQAAACWLAVVGRYAYTTNAASGSIGTFAVAPDGAISDIATTPIAPNAHPLDEAGVNDGHFLYVLADGQHQILGYKVAGDGGLTEITSAPVPADVVGVGAH